MPGEGFHGFMVRQSAIPLLLIAEQYLALDAESTPPEGGTANIVAVVFSAAAVEAAAHGYLAARLALPPTGGPSEFGIDLLDQSKTPFAVAAKFIRGKHPPFTSRLEGRVRALMELRHTLVHPKVLEITVDDSGDPLVSVNYGLGNANPHQHFQTALDFVHALATPGHLTGPLEGAP